MEIAKTYIKYKPERTIEWYEKKDILSKEEFKKWRKRQDRKRYKKLNYHKFKKLRIPIEPENRWPGRSPEWYEKRKTLSKEEFNKWRAKQQRDKYGSEYREMRTTSYQKRKERLIKENLFIPKRGKWFMKHYGLTEGEYKNLIKERRKQRVKKQYEINKSFLKTIKQNSKCKYCGEYREPCLVFHHREPSNKKYGIYEASQQSYKTFIKEIDKCDILCHNCHIKYFTIFKDIDFNKEINFLTEQMQLEKDKKRWLKFLKKRQTVQARQYAYEHKKSHCCLSCGESDIKCLSFHHRNPNEKDSKINRLYKAGIKKIREEISKCDILCHNCHQNLHHKLRMP